jgi:hypothetical protein
MPIIIVAFIYTYYFIILLMILPANCKAKCLIFVCTTSFLHYYKLLEFESNCIFVHYITNGNNKWGFCVGLTTVLLNLY